MLLSLGVACVFCVGCHPAAPTARQVAMPATQSVSVAIGPSTEPEAVHQGDFVASARDATAVVAPAPANVLMQPANPVRGSIAPPTGHACRVHFRRDAMGLSGGVPLVIGQESIAGRSVEMSGTIERVTEDWLVLRAGEKRWWIPRGVILAIELTDEQ